MTMTLFAHAEWRTEIIAEFVQRAKDTQQQIRVMVVAANSGGLLVRSRTFSGTNTGHHM